MSQKAWTAHGFEDFSKGTFGNAGQNLYVSRAGVLQRIHQFDLNQDGYFDLVFCNSQAHSERVPAYVIRDPFGEKQQSELITEGAVAGTLCDLNGDGREDLIIGCLHNGINMGGVNAHIYFSSPEGWSERYQVQVPAHQCKAVAAGDFRGCGKPGLAFLLPGGLRLFHQSEWGIEPKRFEDLQITGLTMDSGDLDGDGFCDLVISAEDGTARIYWGSEEGISPDRFTEVPLESGKIKEEDLKGVSLAEYVADAPALVRIIDLGGPHIFAPTPETARFIPVNPNRGFGEPIVLDCPMAMAAATGDVNGDGHTDLIFACRQPAGDQQEGERRELSWIYWGGTEGFDQSRRTSFEGYRACDVAVGDLDGDGCDDVVLCQNRTAEYFTHESLIYRGTPDGLSKDPVRIETHDARRALIGRGSDERNPQLAFINHFGGTASDVVKASIYYGGPDGFSPDRREDVAGSGSVEAIYTDIDDDGKADLVIVNASEYSRAGQDTGSFILLNGKNGFPEKPDFVFPTTHAHGGACADLNHDGYLDLVFGGFGYPDLLFFYGNEKGFDTKNPVRLKMEYDGVVYNEPRWLYLADLNNDGWLDLFVPQIVSERSFVLWGGPEGFSMDRIQFLSAFHICCARAADLTGNGYLDLLLGGHRQSMEGPADSFVYIYWNGPDGLREDRKMLLPANATNSMALADFNGDGTLDLFVGCYASPRERDLDSYIYWNREGRGFSADDRSRLFTHSASGCIACDFDLDGRVDLAVANHKVEGNHVGWSAVYWNGPDGFDYSRTTRLPTSGPHGMNSIGPGNIADRGPEEYYVSPAFQLPEGTRAGGISWKADIPDKTWIRAQMRFAASEAALGKAPWTGSDGNGDWMENGSALPRRKAKTG